MNDFSVGVIGNGIAGLSAAFALAVLGYNVTVLDRHLSLGQGASGAAVGALIPSHGSRSAKLPGQIGRFGLEIYPQWIELIRKHSGVNVSFEKRLGLRLLFEKQKTFGKLLSREELQDREPGIVDLNVTGAEVVPDCAQVDAQMLLRALAQSLLRLGVTFIQTEVLSIASTSNFVCIQGKEGWEERFDFSVIAGGYQSSELALQVGIQDLLVSDWGQMIQCSLPYSLNHFILSRKQTFVPRDEQSIWAAGFHQVGIGSLQQQEYASRFLFERSQETFGNACTVNQVWSGVRPRVPGGLPLVGSVDSYGRIFICTGPGSNGFLYAPVAAQVLTMRLQSPLRSALQEFPSLDSIVRQWNVEVEEFGRKHMRGEN
jgi:glycine/D-amino acid oxidase-like deaminating enzyme